MSAGNHINHKLHPKEGKVVRFSDATLEKVKQIMARYPSGKQKSALLPILHIAQEELGGYLSVDVMDYVAGLLNIQPIEVYEVATFYTQYYLDQVGKYVIEVCQTGPCAMCGGEEIAEYLGRKLSIKVGETTTDGLFTLRKVECLGACGYAPVMQINTEFHERLTKEKIDAVIEDLRSKANEDKPKESTWVEKILLDKVHIPGIKTFKVYRDNGGYASVEKALKQMTPAEVIEEVKKSGLRGRGGAGFPTGMKWSFLDTRSNNPRYLVCNADESEPGTFKDRYLIDCIPHILIEGLIVSSFALGANTTFIYVRGEFKQQIGTLNKAIREAYDNGFLGKNILGTSFSLDIHVQSGGGAYICGEETALLESLEGKRGNPRLKPPFPAVKGLYDCPTVVNNVETLAAVVPIINMGGDEYAKIGVGRSTGTKLISACGHIKNPGVYEIELGLSVEEFLNSEEYCGGVSNGKKIKALIPGGSSVPILPAHLITKTAAGESRNMSYESLSDGGFQSGSMLGSGGFIVFDEDACIIRNTWNFSRFYHHESCGQCSPCREGTGWIEKVLHRIEHGEGRAKDIDLLDSVAKKMEGNTICPLGDAAAWPVSSAIRHFRKEFEFHIENPEVIKNVNHGSLAKFLEKSIV